MFGNGPVPVNPSTWASNQLRRVRWAILGTPSQNSIRLSARTKRELRLGLAMCNVVFTKCCRLHGALLWMNPSGAL